MAIKNAVATIVVTKVRSEQDHGLRNLERRGPCRDSGILAASMASFGGTEITIGSLELSLSICPFRNSAVFQFVLGTLLLAVEGL